MRLSILSIGDELLEGSVLDTNSQWLSEQLGNIGIIPSSHMTVGDQEAGIVGALQYAVSQSDCCIITGGIGPTFDDQTRAAVAKLAQVMLVFREDIYQNIQDFLTANKLISKDPAKQERINEANKCQAYIPESATVLDNSCGTAPGFKITVDGCQIYSLPGVPREMKAMAKEYVLADLQASNNTASHTTWVGLVGIAESAVNQMFTSQFDQKDYQVNCGLYANLNTVKIKVNAIAKDASQAQAQVAKAVEALTTIFGKYIYSDSGDSLAGALYKTLQANNKTIATAESCTGGLIGHLLTDQAGISQYYKEGFVTYSNEAKMKYLHVPEAILIEHGAVSAETATAMVKGLLEQSQADAGVAVTGIAGPDGGTADKPVGLVFIAVANQDQDTVIRCQFRGDRNAVKQQTAFSALNLLRTFC